MGLFSLIICKILNYPISTFFFFSWIFNINDFGIFIFIVFAIIIDFLIQTYGRITGSKANLSALISELQNEIIEIEVEKRGYIEEINNQDVLQKLPEIPIILFEMFRPNKKFFDRFRINQGFEADSQTLKFFLFDPSEGKINTSIRAYVCPFNRSYIILNDYPSDLNNIQKFLLFHELGHATLSNYGIASQKYSIKYHCITMFFIIALSINNLYLLIPIAISLYAYGFAIYDQSNVDAEINADMWGLNYFNKEDRVKIVNDLLYTWDKFIKDRLEKYKNSIHLIQKNFYDIKDNDKVLEDFLNTKMFEQRRNALNKYVKLAKDPTGNIPVPHLSISIFHIAYLSSIIICSIFYQEPIIWFFLPIFLFFLNRILGRNGFSSLYAIDSFLLDTIKISLNMSKERKSNN